MNIEEPIEVLQKKHHNLILEGKFDQAVQVGQELELCICEGFSPIEAYVEFYFVHLVSLLIVSDLDGARYLWRRVPAALKAEASDFAHLWNAAKFLFQQDLTSALSHLLGHPWTLDSSGLVVGLVETLRREQLELISKSYSSVSVEYLAANLVLPREQIIEVCAARSWPVDPDQGFAHPSKMSQLSDFSLTKVEDNLAMIRLLSGYVAHFETKQLTVDLSKAPATATAGGGAGAGAGGRK